MGRAHPDTPPAPPLSDAGLTGDWGGVRTRLAGDGLTFYGGYVSELAYNATGGEHRVATEAGEIDLGFAADLQRLAGLPGGVFKATLTDRRGHDLGQAADLGLLQEVQEINGRGHTWRLTEFWYEQTLGAARIKVGRSPPNTDFAAFSCEFQNLSFCSAAPGNFVTDTWFNWPIGQWSARLRVEGRNAYVQAGAYVINPRDLEERLTLGYLNGATGVLYPFEIGWSPAIAGHAGTYKIGGWYSTADISGVATAPKSSRFGGWIDIQQDLGAQLKTGGTGLSVFFNLTQADRGTAEIDQQVAVGLFYGGLIAARPQDVVGLGLARTHLNGHIGDGQIGPTLPPRMGGAEYAAEAYYSFRPRSWLSLSPNLQLVEHPGGVTSRRAVVVLGLKAGLRL